MSDPKRIVRLFSWACPRNWLYERVDPGVRFKRWFGVAWYDYEHRVCVTVLMPFNVLVRWAYLLYLWTANPPPRRTSMETIRRSQVVWYMIDDVEERKNNDWRVK